MNDRATSHWRARCLQIAAAAIMAACGGADSGGGSFSVMSGMDVPDQAAPAASCTINQAKVLVEAIRISQADAQDIVVTLPQPRSIDLLDPGAGVLEALQLAPLTRDATEVRLRVAQGSTVRLDDGTVAPLRVPGNLRLVGDFRLAAGMVADLVVQGFDHCGAIHAAGRSGQFVLNGEVPAQLRALTFVTDREQPTNGSLRVVPGGGYATVSNPAPGNFAIQRFNAYGGPVGDATTISVDGMAPSVTPLSNGFVLTTWLGPAVDPEVPLDRHFPLMVQRFTADGTPQGVPVEVALTQPFSSRTIAPPPRDSPVPPSLPRAAALADGGAALVWVQLDEGSLNVYLQRFAADGSAAGGAQRANVGDAGGLPNVIGLAGNRVLVAWGLGPLHARVFQGDGSAGPEQAITPTAPSLVAPPQLAALTDGGAQMTWTGLLFSRFPIIEMVRLAPDGSPLAPPQLLFDGVAPSVAALADGGFVVAWFGDRNVYAQRFNADGSPAGAVAQVNVTSTAEAGPSVVALPWGGFLIGWLAEGGGQDFMRFFDAQGLLGE
jgi:hypothetical protein